MANTSGIHINPKNAGKLRAQMGAKAGKNLSVTAERARLRSLESKKVKTPEDIAEIKRLNFAINASGWKH